MYSKKASCGQDRKLEVLLDCLLLPMEGMPATRRTDSGSAWVGPGLPSCDRRLHSSRSHGESTTSRVWSGGSRGCGAFPPSSWGSSSSSQQQEGIRDRFLKTLLSVVLTDQNSRSTSIPTLLEQGRGSREQLLGSSQPPTERGRGSSKKGSTQRKLSLHICSNNKILNKGRKPVTGRVKA